MRMDDVSFEGGEGEEEEEEEEEDEEGRGGGMGGVRIQVMDHLPLNE